jgi:hypothetical protein
VASFLAVWLARTGSEVIGRGMERRCASEGHHRILAAPQEGVRDRSNSETQNLSMVRWDTPMHGWARRGRRGRSPVWMGETGRSGPLAGTDGRNGADKADPHVLRWARRRSANKLGRCGGADARMGSAVGTGTNDDLGANGQRRRNAEYGA